MRNKMLTFLCAMFLLLAGCNPSGPQKALDEMATALDKNNVQAFLAHMDMEAYATNYLNRVTNNNDALSSLKSLGDMFGLGDLTDLIGNMVDIKSRVQQDFEQGVASGELMAQCRASNKPECPWVPLSLRDAEVIELNDNAAIAKVTTPARLTSWLIMRKFDQTWKVIGQAILESQARKIALDGLQKNGAKPLPKSNKPSVNI